MYIDKMKQSKTVRKQEKLRKYVQRRETFTKLFLKCWAALLLLVILITGIGAYWGYRYNKLSAHQKASEDFMNLISDMIVRSANETRNDFIQAARVGLAEAIYLRAENITGVWENSYLLVDAETEQVAADSKIFVSLTVMEQDSDSRRIYSCQSEIAEQIYKDYLAVKESFPVNGITAYVESYYMVNESDIIPARVIFKDILGEIKNISDYLPENAEDYPKVTVKEEENGRLAFFGHGLANQADIIIRTYASEYIGNNTMYDLELDTLPFGTVGFYFQRKIWSDEGDYYLCGMSIYHMMDEIGYILVISYISLFLFTIGIAGGLAYRNHIFLNVRYQMEDERRRLTNAMAHDLKSPLMAISGYAENLKDNVHTEKREHYAEVIWDSVQYMNGIISNILNLAKLEEGGAGIEKEPIELIEVLEKLAEHYQQELEKKQIAFELKGSCQVKGSRQLLTQALDNLISNSVKYTPPKGRIAVEGSRGRLKIQNDSTEQPGLEPEALLQPFVKGDNSRGNHQGSGVGLAIVKTIADLHGFKMNIRCDEDKFVVEWRMNEA